MSELIDLVNQNGKTVEYGVDRSLVDADRSSYAARGLYMSIAVVVILNETGEVLWHRRHPNKDFEGNKIDHVCGSVLAGEGPEEAAVREAKQEVGVEPKNLQEVRRRINEYGCYCILFLGHSNEVPVVNLEKEEVSEAGYSSLEELREREASGEGFVEDFFPDVEAALEARVA